MEVFFAISFLMIICFLIGYCIGYKYGSEDTSSDYEKVQHFFYNAEIYSDGYNKAIDDFAEELKKYTYGRTNGVYVEIPMYKVDELAEQLKKEQE